MNPPKAAQYEEVHEVQGRQMYRDNFILKMKDQLKQLSDQFEDRNIKVIIRIETA